MGLLEEDGDPLLIPEDVVQLFGRADQDVRDSPETLFFAVVVSGGVREEQEDLIDQPRIDHPLGLLVCAVRHVADDLKDFMDEAGLVHLEQLQEPLETLALDEVVDGFVRGEVEQRREDRVERALVAVLVQHVDEGTVHCEAQLQLFFERPSRRQGGQRPAGVLRHLLVCGGGQLLDEGQDDVRLLQPLLERLVLLRYGPDGPGALLEDFLFVAADDFGEDVEEPFVDETLDARPGPSADVRDAPAGFELGQQSVR